MTKKEQQTELKDKIIEGLEKTYDKLLEFKKANKSELVIMQEDKIVRINPK
jgi:hypothetical protein